MKTIYGLFFLVFTLSSTQAQWTNQNPVPNGNTLRSVFFVNDNIGWIVGSEGFILKTTDAGIDWIQQNSGTNTYLKKVKFVDEQTGWVVGESGLILKTTDGGSNWISQFSGTTKDLYSLYFFNRDTGWVVGWEGTILKTTNGGTTWTYHNTFSSYDLFSVCFVNNSTGWAVGVTNADNGPTPTDSSIIIKTTNGGQTWVKKGENLTNFPTIGFLTVEFIDANNGFIGGGEYGSNNGWKLYRTTDGGENWFSVNYMSKRITKTNENFYNSYAGIHDIYFKDANNGYSVYGTNTYFMGIMVTTDGGANWINKYSHSEQFDLFSVFVTMGGKGWAVGANGQIFKTEDNGTTWSQQLSGGTINPSFENLYKVQFVSDSVGWAVGQRGDYLAGQSLILKTTNSGKVWKTQYCASGDPLKSVYFLDHNIGWADVFKTTNGGENWSLNSSNIYNISSIFFIDQDTGWATGSEYSPGVFKSTDGGQTWIEKSSSNCSSLYFTNINNGWAVGAYGTILKSTDKGETWVTKTSGTTTYLNSVKFYNLNLGMCVGNMGIVLLSTDAGESWVSKNSGNANDLMSITFTNSTSAWIAGINGTILQTTDLGNNWTSFDGVTSKNLNTIYFSNENTGWVSGLSGAMFKYSTEPIPPSNHFTKVWSGNPHLAMNIYITSATINDLNIGIGDEIGVFDGDICVGTTVLSESIPSGGYVQVLAATDDPTTSEVDGFIPGNTITYKLWDSNNQSQINRVTASYTEGNGNFVSQGTAVVNLAGIYTVTENIGLIGGWNILSVLATPDNSDMLRLLDPLITSDVLIKVQDETGNAVEQLPEPIGWINNIGSWLPTEGYYIKISKNSVVTLSVTGPPLSLPLDIPLTNGWNIMSYPVPINEDALSLLQPLISAGQLVKVQDEAGNAIENLGSPIGWINNIGELKSGEGYYIKVNTNTSITLNEPTTPKQINKEKRSDEPESLLKITAKHFVPVYSGNPYLAMNIYITGAELIGGSNLGAGDEIGIFDGNNCVGAIVLTGSISSFISMVASTDDPGTPEIDGFTQGHTIIYKFWLSASSEEIKDYTANYYSGDGTFVSQGTATLSFTNILPVELTSFKAEASNNEVNLIWETAAEVNNYGFDIERKVLDTWKKIGFVAGNGNSNSHKEYSYIDSSPTGGTKIQYRIKQIDNDGKYKYSKVIEVEVVPKDFALHQNYPNPFNPSTKIRYQLPKQSKIVIKLYNILGSEVKEILNDIKEPGIYEIEVNANNLPSGVYFYRLQAGSFVDAKKMILMK